MADETPASPAAEQKAVPSPAPVLRPAPDSPVPPESDADKRARAAELRREAAALDALAGGIRTVNVKVEPPHSELHFGGLSVGNDFTPIPADRLASLQGAASNAGVELTTEG
jgi:hypothetical protein